MKKSLNDLTEPEQQSVKQFMSNPRPGLGIDSVVFTAEGSYVIFSAPQGNSPQPMQ
jgi:hypothetical protein